MARKRSRSKARDHSTIATHSVRWNPIRAASLVRVSPVDLRIFEDRRTYHPAPAERPALSFGGRPVQLKPAYNRNRVSRSGGSLLTSALSYAFRAPPNVLICVRRKMRRQVLLAKGKGGANRRGRKNSFSDVRC
ncbi:hypothetical protein [Apis mellifera associated microvirus 43]|nr:hypothetical protein [Apis mellifera associated microvirus 43]